MSAVLTTDHPAWDTCPDGRHVRAVRSASGLWWAAWGQQELEVSCVDGSEDDKPIAVSTETATLPQSLPGGLREGLVNLGVTRRLANPWLWDAITTAILRQVVRAAQARHLYRTWCRTYGTAVHTPAGQLHVAPAPDHVLELDDDQFATVGVKFHRTALRAAAAAYLEHSTSWQSLPAADLVPALISVPRIGPWTAAAAACDFTGDFTHYPHADLAVRTWAARIAPDHPWPQTEKAFGTYWRNLAPTERDLHTLTLTTLTWGAHARTAQHTVTRP
ncbi:hypothetical protein [Streptomyces anulatus]|uniref:hypothetical protein n=1 Tax=Streptomyces anulatus TaxID=1892 RepID=UPI003F4A16E0